RGRHAAAPVDAPVSEVPLEAPPAADVVHQNGHSTKPKRGGKDDLVVPRPVPGAASGRQLLGEILVQQRMVTAAALGEVLDEQGANGPSTLLGEALVKLGLLDEVQL